MSIYNNPSIRRIPGYYATQVHPENEVMPVLEAFAQLKTAMQQMTWNQLNKSPSPAPNPEFRNEEPAEQASITERYHYQFSGKMMESFRTALEEYLPPEAAGYFTAIAYAEKHLLTRQITALQPGEFLDIINRINLCMNQLQFQGIVYRATNSYIYSAQMPKERTKATFSQVDQYILGKATADQKKLWTTTTRTKVWKAAFAKNREAPSFTDAEKELLKGLMGCTPSFEIVPGAMTQFAQDFCAKVQANEELDSLCSWAHQKLIDIHPYWESDGRTARFLLNLIRMWVGEQPLLFDNDQNYTRAAQTLDPQAFHVYLQELKSRQIQLEPILDQCLRQLYEETLKIAQCDQLMKRVLSTQMIFIS